jgi:hypothetical protein
MRRQALVQRAQRTLVLVGGAWRTEFHALQLQVLKIPAFSVIENDGEIESANLDAGLGARIDVAGDAPAAAVPVFHGRLIDGAVADRIAHGRVSGYQGLSGLKNLLAGKLKTLDACLESARSPKEKAQNGEDEKGATRDEGHREPEIALAHRASGGSVRQRQFARAAKNHAIGSSPLSKTLFWHMCDR